MESRMNFAWKHEDERTRADIFLADEHNYDSMNKTFLTVKLSLIAISLVVASELRAEDPAKKASPMGFLADVMIEYLDTNSDHVIDIGEYQVGCARGFGEMDTDGDGFITKKELEALGGMLIKSGENALVATASGVLLASWIKSMDADGDGRVSRDEFLKGCGKYFDKLDENKDQKLTRDELLALPAKILTK